jgi:DNA/RNA-binding domain of Phe-tRNA-synthetase-like protein
MTFTPPILLSIPGVALGWVLARGCRTDVSSPSLLEEVRIACARAVASADSEGSKTRRSEVRNLLRHGVYKPTGRGKPASEYLLNAALGGDFPMINRLVDINNLVSVETLLPISLVDLERAGTERFEARRGRSGESYVFNPSGQILELEDLLLLARLPEETPCATPVKDSQATKTHAGTQDVLGAIYAPVPLALEAREAARRMAQLMEMHCEARTAWGGAP